MNIEIVIIEDSEKFKEDPLMWSLEERFGSQNIKFITNPNQGIEYILENLDKNIIVFLDINFDSHKLSGHDVLEEIAKKSRLVPVILWSGIDQESEPFEDFINNNALAFIGKDATSEELNGAIDKAVLFFESSVDNAIEDWIIANDEDKDKPIFISTRGEEFSLSNILEEIRLQTKTGKEFVRRFNMLTIDLLLRNKENING